MMRLFRKQRPGNVLLFTLAVLAMLFVLTSAALSIVQLDQYLAVRSYGIKQARNLAEAGIDRAIRQLNVSHNYTGETLALGSGEFVVVVSGTGSTRKIESSGYIPNSANPRSKIKIITDAQISSAFAEFFYGIQVDGGGLHMNNNSVVNGNVYSNGSITGDNGSRITGDAIVAGGLTSNPTLEYPAGCTSSCGDADQLFATAATNSDIAQSFTATASGNLHKVSVYLGKVGSPANNLTVRIAADASGRPDTSSLASTGIAYTIVGATPSWIDATFSSPANLTSGTKYWIVLDYSTNSAIDHWNWRKDSSDAYASNTGRFTDNCCSGNPTWTDVGGDLGFRAWIGGTITELNGVTVGSSTSGTARANQFTNATVHGSACPNAYCIVENPAPSILPLSDGTVADWKSEALAGGVHSGNYDVAASTSATLGPKKIEGDLTLGIGSTLTMAGTLWVTGNISLANSATIRLDPGYDTESGTIVTDGTALLSNGAVFVGAGTGSYILLLTTRDAKTETSITVENNSTGVIYYAAKSRIYFSNNAEAKEATAWGITLANNAIITYDTGLASSSFSSGPGAGWAVKTGTWREIRSF